MLSACVIVKNEEQYLGRLLTSLQGCTDIVVLDTGSTDGTLELARRFPGVRCFSFAWTDNFSEARNAAARYAVHDWVCWLDADMYFAQGELARILAFLPRVPPQVDAIMVRVRDGDNVSPSPRIYHRHLRFSGAVHEDLNSQCPIQTPFELQHQRQESPVDRRDKDERYQRLLEAELQANPASVHALMYLRDIAFAHGDQANTQDYCARLLQLQDDYLCHYYLGIQAYRRRDFAQAVVLGFHALEASAMDPRVYLLLADAYDELGHKVAALVFYEHALHLPEEARLVATRYPIAEDDYSVVPLVNKAKVLADLGLKDKALACYAEALERRPETPHRASILHNRELLAGGGQYR